MNIKSRYLGLDFGTKTLGISISDETKTIATSYKTIHYLSKNELLKEVKNIMEKENIEKIVLGFPRNMNNSVGPKGEETLKFKEQLEGLNVEVVLQDERLSTKEATSYLLAGDVSRKKRKKVIDSLAANIILQTYLDKKKGN